VGGLDGVTGFPGTAKSRIGNLYYGVRNKMIQAPKGHAFHACMKKDDFGTRKTPKSSHFSQKNERI